MILRECGFDERTIAETSGDSDLRQREGLSRKTNGKANRRRTKVPNLAPAGDGANEKRKDNVEVSGGRTRIRTLDPLIKSQLLYQLSYAP